MGAPALQGQTAQGKGSRTGAGGPCANPYCSCDPCGCKVCKCGAVRLSSAEQKLMEFVWRAPRNEVTVRDVANEFPKYAYSTVATLLDRLVVKGILRSRLVAHTKRYVPVGSQDAHTVVLMHDALAADRDPDAALRRFVDGLTLGQKRLLRRHLK
jgi:predicted transcriptional regulator